MITTVSVTLRDQLGDLATEAAVHWELTKSDIDDQTGDVIKPRPETVTTDADGEASFAAWANTRGRYGSQYRIRVYVTGETQPVYHTLITVPDTGTANLTDIITDPPPELSDAMAALQGAQQAAIEASGSADLSEAWATGTEPDGPGTHSAREYAEQAQTAAQRIPDPTGPDGLLPITDDDALVLREPREVLTPEAVNGTLLAGRGAIIGPRRDAPAVSFGPWIWGPPDAPISGQQSIGPVGLVLWRYPVTVIPGQNRCIECMMRIVYGTGAARSNVFAWGIDDDNYWQAGVSRNGITITEVVGGVATVTAEWAGAASTHDSAYNETDHIQIACAKGTRNASISAPRMSNPAHHVLPIESIDPADMTWVGFGMATSYMDWVEVSGMRLEG